MNDLIVQWVIACQNHKKRIANHIDEWCKLLLILMYVGINAYQKVSMHNKEENATHMDACYKVNWDVD